MYFVSLALAASAGVFYHISQKSIPSETNPILSMMVTFSVALAGTIIWYLFKGEGNSFYTDVRSLNWASVSLGLSVIALEFAVLLAYRSGWQITRFNLFYTFLLASILLPVGAIFFKESISIKSIVGMMVTVFGIMLMKS